MAFAVIGSSVSWMKVMGCLFFFIHMVGVSPGQEAQVPLTFRELTFDFQTVKEDGGPVDHEFIFTNDSGRPVKILSVKASCGCTTPAWTRDAVPHGGKGFIKASFDPRGRPGYFLKSLTVTTDYSPQPVLLQIKGSVQTAAEAANPTAGFNTIRGSLRLQVNSFNLGKVPIKQEPFVREYPVYNGGSYTLSFTSSGKPAYVDVDVIPARLEPGSFGVVRIALHPAKRNAYGFITENITLETDDKEEPSKSFSVYATLEEYFPPLSARDLELAPRLVPDTLAVDFSDVRMGGTSSQIVRLTNGGKKDLHIRAIQPNCTCLTAVAGSLTIKPGSSTDLTITFTPSGKMGAQQKAVTIHASDPRNPIQRIVVTARVI